MMSMTSTMDETSNLETCSGSAVLKEFLIFRLDTLDDVSPFHRELADESALEGEASNYADLMAAYEGEAGIHYEVRSASTGELLYTTESAARAKPERTKRTERNPKTNNARKAGTTGTIRKEAPCGNRKNQLNQLNQPGQLNQLQMAIS
jgi:hypothetical protein